MLGRLFGKDKGASNEPVCYQCGRTLLVGEWTQKVEGPDGEERLLCSLCAKASASPASERLKVGNGNGNAARLNADGAQTSVERSSPRGESDALWKAIKDRDAQIEVLTARLAQSEAERQELIGRLARLQSRASTQAAAPGDAPGPARDEGDQPPLEDTATIPAVAAEDEAIEAPAAEATIETTWSEATVDATSAEATVDATSAEATVEGTWAEAPGEAFATPASAEAEAAAAEPAERGEAREAEATAAASAAELPDAEAQAASMTLLQRGVDLLNVSPVPRKIAETNADLGIPNVHVGFDGETATVTFMWSMGWYRFTVDIETGSVRLGDRGYDDRQDLQPNASVRADGTVHLAAARISRASAQQRREEMPDQAAALQEEERTAAATEGEAASPAAPGGGPEILSKSLLGQRTDDEKAEWERTRARDFDWDE